MKINKKILERMNFSDFSVINTHIDNKLKTICFSLNGAFLMNNGRRVELGEGYLKLVGYVNIFISAYNAKAKIEKVLSEENYEQLNEICEIEIHQDKVIIKGFSKENFNWMEFNVDGGIILGEFIEKY